MNDKLTEIAERLVRIETLVELTADNSKDIHKRVSRLEQKWWTIHGAWLVVSGLMIAFKDKVTQLFG